MTIEFPSLDVVCGAFRKAVPTSAYTWASQKFNAVVCITRTGYPAYKILRDAGKDSSPSGKPVRIQIRGLQHSFWFRPCTTDPIEIQCTLIRKVYDHRAHGDPLLIIDAGANIGDSTVWYLNRYPRARVIAIEPDPENFELLQMNCEPYGGRVELVKAALWHEDRLLKLVDWRDKNAVRVTADTLAVGRQVRGVSMRTLTETRKVDIFKCDIEGAETELFEHGSRQWLGQIGMMLVDVHGQDAERSVMRAATEAGFECRRHREVYVFHRTRRIRKLAKRAANKKHFQ